MQTQSSVQDLQQCSRGRTVPCRNLRMPWVAEDNPVLSNNANTYLVSTAFNSQSDQHAGEKACDGLLLNSNTTGILAVIAIVYINAVLFVIPKIGTKT